MEVIIARIVQDDGERESGRKSARGELKNERIIKPIM